MLGAYEPWRINGRHLELCLSISHLCAPWHIRALFPPRHCGYAIALRRRLVKAGGNGDSPVGGVFIPAAFLNEPTATLPPALCQLAGCRRGVLPSSRAVPRLLPRMYIAWPVCLEVPTARSRTEETGLWAKWAGKDGCK